MENYYLILCVTLDRENAIRTLFEQRGWPFIKSDLQTLYDEVQGNNRIDSNIAEQRQNDIQTNRAAILRDKQQTQYTQNFTVLQNYLKEEQKANEENEECFYATKIDVENLATDKNVSDQTNCHDVERYVTNSSSSYTVDATNNINIDGNIEHDTEIYSERHEFNGNENCSIDSYDNSDKKFADSDNIEIIQSEKVDTETTENVTSNYNDVLNSRITRTKGYKDFLKKKIEKGKKSFLVKKKRKEQEQARSENASIPEVFNYYLEGSNTLSNGKPGKKKLVHCSECDTTFTSIKRFEGHKARNGGQCVFTCEYCGKIFKYRKSKYLIHIRSAHTKERPHTCDLCGKGFVTSDKLKIHRRTHTNERPYICEECGKSFISRADLSTHKNYHHVALENQEELKCDICEVTFCSKRYLAYHKKVTHSEQRDFLCSKCEKCFKSNTSLQQHFKVMHTDIRDYKCSICGQLYKTSASLRKHMFVHSGERNYQCNYCEKAFYDKTKLVHHERTHTGIKPYKCDVCDYTCALSGNLTKHMKTHYRKQHMANPVSYI